MSGGQLAPLVGLRIAGAGDLEQRRHEVGHVHEPVVDAPLGPLDGRSADDERVPDTAFREPALVLAEGRHRHLRPHRAVADVRARIAPRVGMGLRPIDRREEVVTRARRARDHLEEVGSLGAVVAEHDEDRVLVLADLLEVVDEPADVEVEVLHHSGVELHLLAEDGPARRSQHDGIGNEPHPLGELRARGHDAELDLPLQSLLPHRVPTLVVLADVAIAPFPRQVVRIVRRLVGDVGEEGLAVATVGVDESDQLVGVGLRRVVVLGELASDSARPR